MGIRFRKSFKVAPGIRFTLSNSGASVRAGTRNVGISKGSRGTHVGASIPGTGLSAREKIGKRKTSRSGSRGGLLAILAITGIIIVVALLA
ncbi:DUF4236 domain-containing protein [Rhizobium sp. S-51]|uniref:DUF4236 domain-containing protein n=1 Tax=Rhizobium terricola TaxID=2728849 RepID=A0A7Y0FUN7_9HYPH|nr:DUF4236 domain-containing protein [Rhizobium terricola]NML73572.1 DUF4236 domain-containing protein [Rhizobium terricola]